MRLSVIVPFLNSHEIVRRHILHWHQLAIPDEMEILYLDDGSEPPLEVPNPPKNFRLVATNDFRPWTSSLARNTGAKLARGDWFLMTDGDYIIPQQAIDVAMQFSGDRLGFRREFGILDEHGRFTQDRETLIHYGLLPQRYAERGVRISPHPNNFVMRREVFELLGGYREDLILSRPYPQGEDRHFKRALMTAAANGQITLGAEERATLYMFPNGQWCGDVDYNPHGLFHTLSRKTEHNYWYTHQRYHREGVP